MSNQKTQDLFRDAQMSSVATSVLSQLRMIVAQLKALQVCVPDRPEHQADLFTVMVAAVNCHEFLSCEIAKANGNAPSVSTNLLSVLVEAFKPEEPASPETPDQLLH